MEKIKTILNIAKEMQEQDTDSIFLIVGMEGSGKSHLGLHCLEYLNGTPAQIALDKIDFLDILKVIPDERTVVFDEAGDGLFSRDFASQINKELVKTFMIIRGKKLIVFLVLPSFFMLDTYFRRHRVRGLFYVYKRGHVAFFDKRGITSIIHKGEKDQQIKGARPIFYDTYPRYNGYMIEPYKVMKRKKIDDTLSNLNKPPEVKGKK